MNDAILSLILGSYVPRLTRSNKVATPADKAKKRKRKIAKASRRRNRL